jgi:RNA polymerase sigma-70 factor, ECF subfamily
LLDNAEALALLAKIAQGDEQAFQALYRKVSRTVYAFALQRMSDAAGAEEIVVDTLLDVWKQPQRFRGEAKFSTWLLSIARNKVIDRYRAKGPDHEDIQDFAETLPADLSSDAFNQVADQQRREGVAHCLEKLSEEHRECLHLVYFEGMTVGEVSQVQAVPENTVKTRLFHARSKIKNCVARVMREEAV